MRCHLHEYATTLSEGGALGLVVEMRGETVPGSLCNGPEWLWEPLQSWLSVDGKREDTPYWFHEWIERHWRDLPGMPDAVQRWQRGAA